MLLEVTGWFAPAATMIAAIMTAANLGARITGWGFVLFTLGAVAWSTEALLTHQQNLLWSNGFLAVVDVIGVYRWLGHRAKLEKGAKAAAANSRACDAPLFALNTLDGAPLLGPDGGELGRIFGAMGDCHSGRIAYLVLASHGVAEEGAYRGIAWKDVVCRDGFRTALSCEEIAELPVVDPASWPARTPLAARP